MRRTQGLSISQYGFLSDSRSAALVASDGQLEWLCWPRFDSEPLFSSLLDAQKGGCWWMRPTSDFVSWQTYVEDSLILKTHFRTESGEAVVTDWLHAGARQALCRLVEGVRGEVEIDTGCDLRTDWGRGEPGIWMDRLGYLVHDEDDGHRVVLDGFHNLPEQFIQTKGEQGLIRPRNRFVIKAGESHSFSLGNLKPGPSNLHISLQKTQKWWSTWSNDLLLPGQYADVVKKSAMVLRGLHYMPSGSFVAAPTTSLPEDPGGERNWDYRYSWVRDAAFTVDALTKCGKYEMAESWVDWLTSLSMLNGIDQIQIMYGVEGERELPEKIIEGITGYRDAYPVRVGNGAAGQQQLDTYGEILDSFLLNRIHTESGSKRRCAYASALADTVVAIWRNPDDGIWEARSGPKHYVHSKVMAWVALDRAVKLAQMDPQFFDGAKTKIWKKEADTIKQEVMQKGAPNGWFQMAYDVEKEDASCLTIGLVGFVEPDHPVYKKTVEQINQNLASPKGWIWRYRGFQDGLDGEEHSFSICTLWMVQALLAIGEKRCAQDLFERFIACSSPLGLFAEELSESGEHWGNYPQAFTHIALIQSAFAFDN